MTYIKFNEVDAPKKVKIELMSNEVEYIIDLLNRANHNEYEFLQYDKIIKKLKGGKK